ncbi:type VI secretion system contractile sheath domain-containing protein, partial [Pseudomonas viridiflava]|uniref:type VI secretion system contractile sheath domain-containing protein n=1 Tax=Pseudomonas viridiflava TaxID=33069 RepID=UPI0013CEB112
ARIGESDTMLSEQMNEIMHASEFQALEASWRGLKYQVDQTETSTTLKIQLLNASKKDLVRDLKTSSEFDQSALFKKIYEEEYGTFGGEPFGMLLGKYEVNRNQK